MDRPTPLPKLKCLKCDWYEPTENAQQGYCMYDPPQAVIMPTVAPQSPIMRSHPQQQQPQVVPGLASMHRPVSPDGRCHHHSDLVPLTRGVLQ